MSTLRFIVVLVLVFLLTLLAAPFLYLLGVWIGTGAVLVGAP